MGARANARTKAGAFAEDRAARTVGTRRARSATTLAYARWQLRGRAGAARLTIRWVGVAAPAAVLCDGQPLSATASGEGYAYDPVARTLTATLDPRDGTRSHTLPLR